MTLKSQVASLASEIEKHADALPARLGDVRLNVETWQTRIRTFSRSNPGLAVVLAFAVGFGLAKVARHA